MQPAIVFRAAASRGYAVATWVVAAAVLAAFAANGGAAEVLRYGALPLLLAVAVMLLLALITLPAVAEDDEGRPVTAPQGGTPA